LDVGCAVGASSFVLGKYFGDVLGVDFSQNFIDAANTLKEKNSLSYTYLVEGDSFKKAEAVPESTQR
jgi:2-polyprenyl-3-methyl-5-hydroxy-6-metoxy-1,4-benzoquinol methylase